MIFIPKYIKRQRIRMKRADSRRAAARQRLRNFFMSQYLIIMRIVKDKHLFCKRMYNFRIFVSI